MKINKEEIAEIIRQLMATNDCSREWFYSDPSYRKGCINIILYDTCSDDVTSEELLEIYDYIDRKFGITE